MSGFMQVLTGGSRQSQSASSSPVDVTPTTFSDLRQPFADVLSSLLGMGGMTRFNERTKQNEEVTTEPLKGIPNYTGQYTAPVSAAEQIILDNLQNMTGPNTARSSYLNDLVSGKYVNPASNPFLDAYIRAAQQPTLQGLTETLTRDLPGRFTAAGQFVNPQGSSAFDRAAAIATRGAADAISKIATDIGYNAYNSERGFQNQGVQLGQQEVNTTISNLQAQALPRLIQQYGLDQGVAEFRNRINSLIQILSLVGGVTQPRVGQTSYSSGSATQNRGLTQGFNDVLSGLGAVGV